MVRSKQQNFRVGSFAAVNTGLISGCSANISFKAKYGGSGFIYDNRGEISNSVSVKGIRGKGSLSGFVFRNSEAVESCGFLGKVSNRKENDGKEARTFRDESLRMDSSLSTEKIYLALGLNKLWKNERYDSLEPDMEANHVVPDSIGTPVEIRDGDELLDIIDAINDGDISATVAHYVLMDNINLRGRKIDPIGVSETTPFRGIFDGNGKTISNFVIDGKGREYAGFFGVAKGAHVVNLRVDYILKSTGSKVSGGMVAMCTGGWFENCAVCINVNPGVCSGGFVGKNGSQILNCYVCGKVAFPLVLWPLLAIPAALLILLLILLVRKDSGGAYVPEIIDPNQVPVINNTNVPALEPGTSRISFEVYQDIYISAVTQVGEMGYVNPARATQDVVVRLCVSDRELVRAGYDLVATGVRTAEELAASGYNPDESYTELYRSGRIQIGFGVDNCKLSPLPNGQTLKVGEYEMLIFIDSYDPVTFEKSIINASAPVTVHIVEQ